MFYCVKKIENTIIFSGSTERV